MTFWNFILELAFFIVASESPVFRGKILNSLLYICYKRKQSVTRHTNVGFTCVIIMKYDSKTVANVSHNIMYWIT